MLEHVTLDLRLEQKETRGKKNQPGNHPVEHLRAGVDEQLGANQRTQNGGYDQQTEILGSLREQIPKADCSRHRTWPKCDRIRGICDVRREPEAHRQRWEGNQRTTSSNCIDRTGNRTQSEKNEGLNQPEVTWVQNCPTLIGISIVATAVNDLTAAFICP